ncbi:hypothetical protein J6590_040535 [Homalodisca vitripennis]|nr:hypothetical protein J6590_040535 [Homalodisca vitripennis]
MPSTLIRLVYALRLVKPRIIDKTKYAQWCDKAATYATLRLVKQRFDIAIDLIVHHIWDILHGSASSQHKLLTQRRASSGSDTLSR